jgi:hypothetical protein
LNIKYRRDEISKPPLLVNEYRESDKKYGFAAYYATLKLKKIALFGSFEVYHRTF